MSGANVTFVAKDSSTGKKIVAVERSGEQPIELVADLVVAGSVESWAIPP
jgi:hypothetical protein